MNVLFPSLLEVPVVSNPVDVLELHQLHHSAVRI